MYHEQILDPRNPFPVNILQTSDAFFDTLTTIQREKRTPIELKRMYEQQEQDLKMQWNCLLQAADEGLVGSIILQLAAYLQGYSRQKALYQFQVGNRADAWNLSRATPGLEVTMKQKLESKHEKLSEILYHLFNEGQRRRKAEVERRQKREAEQLAEARILQAEQTIERQFQYNRDLYDMVLDSHVDGRESLKLAQDGTKQAQDYVPLIMGPVVKLLETIYCHLEQNSPQAMEQAVVRMEQRKRNTKFLWFFVILVAIISWFLIAFLLTQFFGYSR